MTNPEDLDVSGKVNVLLRADAGVGDGDTLVIANLDTEKWRVSAKGGVLGVLYKRNMTIILR